MYHFLYKTTNLINWKYYLGIHSTENLDDNYLGSGTVLQTAIKKYGRKNFSREILMLADSREELIEFEKLAVTQIEVENPQCYNMVIGGNAPPIMTGKKHSGETKKKISEKMSGENHPQYGKKHSGETKKKISEKRSGKMSGKNHPRSIKKIWDYYDLLRKYWIDYDKPGCKKFAKLLREKNIMDYKSSQYTRIIKSFATTN
jgi:group I intron endonuclease